MRAEGPHLRRKFRERSRETEKKNTKGDTKGATKGAPKGGTKGRHPPDAQQIRAPCPKFKVAGGKI